MGYDLSEEERRRKRKYGIIPESTLNYGELGNKLKYDSANALADQFITPIRTPLRKKTLADSYAKTLGSPSSFIFDPIIIPDMPVATTRASTFVEQPLAELPKLKTADEYENPDYNRTTERVISGYRSIITGYEPYISSYEYVPNPPIVIKGECINGMCTADRIIQSEGGTQVPVYGQRPVYGQEPIYTDIPKTQLKDLTGMRYLTETSSLIPTIGKLPKYLKVSSMGGNVIEYTATDPNSKIYKPDWTQYYSQSQKQKLTDRLNSAINEFNKIVVGLQPQREDEFKQTGQNLGVEIASGDIYTGNNLTLKTKTGNPVEYTPAQTTALKNVLLDLQLDYNKNIKDSNQYKSDSRFGYTAPSIYDKPIYVEYDDNNNPINTSENNAQLALINNAKSAYEGWVEAQKAPVVIPVDPSIVAERNRLLALKEENEKKAKELADKIKKATSPGNPYVYGTEAFDNYELGLLSAKERYDQKWKPLGYVASKGGVQDENPEIYGSDAYYNREIARINKITDTQSDWHNAQYSPLSNTKANEIGLKKSSLMGVNLNKPLVTAPAVKSSQAAYISPVVPGTKSSQLGFSPLPGSTGKKSSQGEYVPPSTPGTKSSELGYNANTPLTVVPAVKSSEIGKFGGTKKKKYVAQDGWDALLSAKPKGSKKVTKSNNDGWDRILNPDQMCAKPVGSYGKRTTIKKPVNAKDGWDKLLGSSASSKKHGSKKSKKDAWDKLIDNPTIAHTKKKSVLKSNDVVDIWNNGATNLKKPSKRITYGI